MPSQNINPQKADNIKKRSYALAFFIKRKAMDLQAINPSVHPPCTSTAHRAPDAIYMTTSESPKKRIYLPPAPDVTHPDAYSVFPQTQTAGHLAREMHGMDGPRPIPSMPKCKSNTLKAKPKLPVKGKDSLERGADGRMHVHLHERGFLAHGQSHGRGRQTIYVNDRPT
ncbi:hypothetical protein BDV93DRAFT_157460 [Ceratobasidium sp. AG-I]|nr:hypothetical protein BDV93DRAFT_157460 [Ceratobasidium sp. AG-I]